mmetsp:Transcript_25332/g.59704  ORF Transcript_25332/g.59704 Transcript_25332/m.59704 type:complete len:100 (+) Transcript_25332:106-405(+)
MMETKSPCITIRSKSQKIRGLYLIRLSYVSTLISNDGLDSFIPFPRYCFTVESKLPNGYFKCSQTTYYFDWGGNAGLFASSEKISVEIFERLLKPLRRQ